MPRQGSNRSKKRSRERSRSRPDKTQQIPPQALVEGDTKSSARKMRFACPHCESSLRIPAVKKRMKIRCPRCSGKFYLYPDGRVDAPQSKSAVAADRATFELPKRRKTSSSREKKTKVFEEFVPPSNDDIAQGSLFKSGDFDGTETGYRFETVTALDLASLADLRGSVLGDPSNEAERGYALLPPSTVEVRNKSSKGRKRHAKKRRKKICES